MFLQLKIIPLHSEYQRVQDFVDSLFLYHTKQQLHSLDDSIPIYYYDTFEAFVAHLGLLNDKAPELAHPIINHIQVAIKQFELIKTTIQSIKKQIEEHSIESEDYSTSKDMRDKDKCKKILKTIDSLKKDMTEAKKCLNPVFTKVFVHSDTKNVTFKINEINYQLPIDKI